MSELISPGSTVLIKPNWVYHSNKSGGGMDCMITHPNFVLAVLAEVVLARPGRIIVGDAPIQSCIFDYLVPDGWRDQATALGGSIPIEVEDFRLRITTDDGHRLDEDAVVRDLKDYVRFDLGSHSLLEPISKNPGRFRVTNYDPQELAKTHSKGTHVYLFCREAFEADVILNLPKIKTHKKTGISAALKNSVGLIGSKEFLPHHRVGGTFEGGDNYPGFQPIKRIIEYCFDQANKKIGKASYRRWWRIAGIFKRIQNRIGDMNLDGSWQGNDTAWRMTLDINRILLYGNLNGLLSDTPQRNLYSLSDGIICGQGNGPLSPLPISLNTISFSDSTAWTDLLYSSLMGFVPSQIPLLNHAFDPFRYPLIMDSTVKPSISINGRELNLHDAVELIGMKFQPPDGWQGIVKI